MLNIIYQLNHQLREFKEAEPDSQKAAWVCALIGFSLFISGGMLYFMFSGAPKEPDDAFISIITLIYGYMALSGFFLMISAIGIYKKKKWGIKVSRSTITVLFLSIAFVLIGSLLSGDVFRIPYDVTFIVISLVCIFLVLRYFYKLDQVVIPIQTIFSDQCLLNKSIDW